MVYPERIFIKRYNWIIKQMKEYCETYANYQVLRILGASYEQLEAFLEPQMPTLKLKNRKITLCHVSPISRLFFSTFTKNWATRVIYVSQLIIKARSSIKQQKSKIWMKKRLFKVSRAELNPGKVHTDSVNYPKR